MEKVNNKKTKGSTKIVVPKGRCGMACPHYSGAARECKKTGNYIPYNDFYKKYCDGDYFSCPY